MCSLSFLPHGDGFHLLMNRDEQRTRSIALPPAIHRRGPLRALYPQEPSGGTWIGVNERGMTFALLNWYSRTPLPNTGTISRGSIIPALLEADSPSEAEASLKSFPLAAMNPFRLIIIASSFRSLCEWQSDGHLLECRILEWKRNHWFSSGYDEEKSIRDRGLVIEQATGQSDANSIDWLRRLHGSHAPTKGPFSICMHREDACTVSFTEVTFEGGNISMIYNHGAPCQNSRSTTLAF